MKRVDRPTAGVLFAVLVLLLPLGTAEDIPVVAYVQNAEPEVLAVGVLDANSDPTQSIDPGSFYQVTVLARDNNTLADVGLVTVVIYSASSTPQAADSEQNHYTFSWDDVAGFQNVGGVGALDAGGSQSPSDLAAGQGSWRFAVSLSKKAIQGEGWTVLVSVQDEADKAEASVLIEVTGFVSLAVDASGISFSGQPGQIVQANENPIEILISTNHPVSLGCSATEFVGVQNPDISLGASSFIVDDDPNQGETEEVGIDELVLAGERQPVFANLIAGAHAKDLYIFIFIPETFQDQDYEGSLIFEIY